MVARLPSVLMAAVIAACAPMETPVGSPSDNAVAAPTPAGAIRIGVEQDGQTVHVPVGQPFAIELVGVPTAGYQWIVAHMPDFVVVTGIASGPTIREQREPGYAGGNHWEVTLFAAAAAGSGVIRMEQRRPWESDEAPAATFRVTIVAH